MPAARPRIWAFVKCRMCARHLRSRTVQAYAGWIIRYIQYHDARQATALGETETIALLTHLVDRQRVSRSTSMQTLSALLSRHREVLAVSVGDVRRVLRSNALTCLPAVLSRGEVRALLGKMERGMRLFALLV